MEGFALQVVPLLDLRHGDVVFPRNAAKALAFFHHVDETVAHLLHLFLNNLSGFLGLAYIVVNAVLKLREA